MRLAEYYNRMKYSRYPWWYNWTIGLVVDSRLYWYIYYKHSKKHKADLEAVREGVLERKREILRR